MHATATTPTTPNERRHDAFQTDHQVPWDVAEASGEPKTETDVRLFMGQLPFDLPLETIVWLVLFLTGVRVRKVDVIFNHNGSPPTRRGFHVYCKNARDADRVVLMANQKAFCTRDHVCCRRHWSAEDLAAAHSAALLDVSGGGVSKGLLTVEYATSAYKRRASSKAVRASSLSDASPTIATQVDDAAACGKAMFVPFTYFGDLAAKVLRCNHASDAECARASDALRRLTQTMLPHVGNVKMSHLVNLLFAAEDRTMSPPCTAKDYMTLHHALTHSESTMLAALIRYVMEHTDGNVALRPIADALKLEKEPGALLYLVSFWQWLHARDYSFTVQRG